MSGTVENLEAAAETFKKRNQTYGNSFITHGAILKAFFPNGIALVTEKDMCRFAVFNAIVGKLNRYGTNFNKGGHQDSIHDAITFCAMLEEIDASS